MIRKVLFAAALALSAAVAPIASAAELLVNGSFEDAGGATREGWGGFTYGAGFSPVLPGWIINSGTVDITDNTTPWKPADTGVNSLDLNGWDSGSISQSFMTLAGVTYHVSYAFSRNLAGAADPATALVTVAGVNHVISAANDGSFGTLNSMLWKSGGFTFTGTGNVETLRFASTSPGSGGLFLDSISAAVPEPGTWALMIMGFGGAGAMLRKRRHVQFA
jgi:hypothetical protein